MYVGVIIETNEEINVPEYSFGVGGLIRAVFPKSFESLKIKQCLVEYVERGKKQIIEKCSRNLEEYRAFWNRKIESICSEYGPSQDFPIFDTPIRISVAHQALINAVAEVHGLSKEIRFNFNPLSSLVSDELNELLLRRELLHESIKLYQIDSLDSGIYVADLVTGKKEYTTVVRKNKELYEIKVKELKSEYDNIKKKLASEEVKEELDKLSLVKFARFNI